MSTFSELQACHSLTFPKSQTQPHLLPLQLKLCSTTLAYNCNVLNNLCLHAGCICFPICSTTSDSSSAQLPLFPHPLTLSLLRCSASESAQQTGFTRSLSIAGKPFKVQAYTRNTYLFKSIDSRHLASVSLSFKSKSSTQIVLIKLGLTSEEDQM